MEGYLCIYLSIYLSAFFISNGYPGHDDSCTAPMNWELCFQASQRPVCWRLALASLASLLSGRHHPGVNLGAGAYTQRAKEAMPPTWTTLPIFAYLPEQGVARSIDADLSLLFRDSGHVRHLCIRSKSPRLEHPRS